MCQQWDIKAISHTNTIHPVKHLNESQLHLNKYKTIEFANIFKNFLYNLSWRDLDKSAGFDQYEASFLNFVRNVLHSDHNENLNENGSEQSIPFSEYHNNNDNKNLIDSLIYNILFNPSKLLNDIRQMNSNSLVIAQ